MTEPRQGRPAGGGVVVIPNPYVWDSGADLEGRRVTISFTWDSLLTRALLGIVVHRDAGCQFTKILVGLGSDGTPDATDKVIDLSGLEGDRQVPGQRIDYLLTHGLATIDDILALQVTAA
jgi:hypothetical protein